MSNVLDSFIDKKKAESKYISLGDGDSITIKKVKDMKMVTKVGFGGDEVEALRLTCLVETEFGDMEKIFDNSTRRFAQELKDNDVKVGSGFVLTREGEKGDTRYIISDVINF